jgi:hypothetical protein
MNRLRRAHHAAAPASTLLLLTLALCAVAAALPQSSPAQPTSTSDVP